MPTQFHLRIFFVIAMVFAAVVMVRGGWLSPAVVQPTPEIANGPAPIQPELLTGEYDPTDTLAVFMGRSFQVAEVPSVTLARAASKRILGSSDDADAKKRIEVDLSAQKLLAYEGDSKVYEFLISSGKWNRTPTGSFRIWGKFRFTKMEGGNKAARTYYYLPNVPYVMFFSNDEVAASRGFSLHGTYWHSNFGHPMSHGCVNMKTEEAALIYDWSMPKPKDEKARTARADKDNPGTEVVIYGEAPKE